MVYSFVSPCLIIYYYLVCLNLLGNAVKENEWYVLLQNASVMTKVCGGLGYRGEDTVNAA